MGISKGILILLSCMCGSHYLQAQGDFKAEYAEKVLKDGNRIGLKSTSKYGKGVIPPEYENLQRCGAYVLGYKNGKVDVYERNIFFTPYLKSVKASDTSMILDFYKLSYDRGSSLLFENGKWGWKTKRGFVVAPQYDSMKTFENWYYKVYKNGKVALADIDNKLIVPFLPYEIEERKMGDLYKISTLKQGESMRLLGLYKDSAHFIAPQFSYLELESFAASVSYQNQNYYSWIIGTLPNGTKEYVDIRNVRLFSSDEVASFSTRDRQNAIALENEKNAAAERVLKKKAFYEKLRVFRNQEGKLGLLSENGTLVVPAGLSSISLGWVQNGSIELQWKASPGAHGLTFTDPTIKDQWIQFPNDTMILFREKGRLDDPKLCYPFDAYYSTTFDLSIVPEGGFQQFSKIEKCSNCKNGKIPAHSYKVTEDYVISEAKTVTKTETLVSKDLGKDGKFPTRTTTTTTPAVMGKRTNTVYEPEKICNRCAGKGNIEDRVEWNEKLGRFERKINAASAPF